VTRLALHTRCTGWALAGGLLGLAVTAYGQEAAIPVVPMADPATDLFLRLAQIGGLPTIAAYLAWQGRSLLQGGLVVRLSDEDRELLKRGP